jgi:hypothetical protein
MNMDPTCRPEEQGEKRMDLLLVRREYLDCGIFGEIDCGSLYFFTLEHSYDKKPIVPAGTYKCTRFDSPKFGYQTFMLNDVPGHDHILIHIGNYNHDSEGCILIGLALGRTGKGGVMLTSSKQAFAHFMALQEGVDEFTLTIEDTGKIVA